MKLNNIKVSIIVPIYKSEKYIDGLMDSVLNQTFKDFELLVVNDGSSDNSLDVLHNWEKNDQRIRVIDKPNGGVSSARNAGIEEAQGEYLWFHDHDDYAFPDTLDTMFNEIEGRDFLIAGWLKCQEKANISKLNRISKVQNRIVARDLGEMEKNLPFSGWIGVIWRCLFKRSVLIENNIRFRELNHEDTLFIYEYLSKCTSCIKIDYQGYVFMDTPNSLGSSHKYNVDEQWLEMAKAAAQECFKVFGIKENSSWNKTLHVLYTPHCACFVTTGYHNDSKLPFANRINRWKYLQNNSFWDESRQFGFITNFQKIIWYISHYKLYYIADPFLLLLTQIHDSRLKKKWK